MAVLIHPSAVVDSTAEIGEGVSVGPMTIIGPGVRIGDRTRIDSHCVIGHTEPTCAASLEIGHDSIIRSHSVLYSDSRFGPRLETGHHVTIRERTIAGENFRIGTGSDIQGDVQIGDFVRVNGDVQINKYSHLSDFVWLFPHVLLTNDPHPPSDGQISGVTVDPFAVLCAGALVMPGVRIGRESVTAAGSLVTRDVPDGQLVRGVPAKIIGPASMVSLRDGSGHPAYPWRRHFHRGYPPEVVEEWLRDESQR